jgi:radical SAM superfamily enzyme YgiQ (UPF0313 family)
MSRLIADRLRQRLVGEIGTITKPHAGKLRIALAYPNRYHIGMSNVGFQAVYKFWNELPDVVCELVFLPDDDELEDYEHSKTSLLSLETQQPVRDFDVLAFSITFEPDEVNLVRILDLAGIPPLAAERGDNDPLVIAGGPITFLNPEPMAPFLDAIAIGEAEALLPPLTDALRVSTTNSEILTRLEQEEGIYVPARHRRSKLVRAKMGKRADFPPPATYVLTHATELSNKFLVEVSRGCPTLCRFCWAGYNYLPKRSFQVEKILEVARDARRFTDQIGLVSTAVGAHKEIVPLCEALKDMGYRVSVSSLRFEDLRGELLDPLSGSGEKTLAVAPEVGTDRLRFAIHKRVTNAEILEKTNLIFSRGIENLKLYLMVGLPTETEEDVEGIVDLVSRIREQLVEHGRIRGHLGRLIPSINPFIPKPGTPFQWHAMERPNVLAKKMKYLKRALARMPNVDANFKSPRQEKLQALLSLGDQQMAPVLLRLARGETNLGRALKEAGIDADSIIHRERSLDELLPWGHIDNGMKPELLESQYEKAQASAVLEPA